MIATISTNAHAGAFWGFMSDLFTGKNLAQNCTVVNASDPLQASTLVQATRGNNVSYPPAATTTATH